MSFSDRAEAEQFFTGNVISNGHDAGYEDPRRVVLDRFVAINCNFFVFGANPHTRGELPGEACGVGLSVNSLWAKHRTGTHTLCDDQ